MKATVVLCVLLPALAAASVQTVLDDFTKIGTQSQKVTTEVKAFTGDINDAITIYGDSNTLDAYLKQTISDAAALPSLSDTDSATIANAVTGLQGTTYDALDALVSKKKYFFGINNATVNLVEQSLSTLRNDTAVLGKTIVGKLVPVLAKVSPLITSNLDFHFSRAVDAYNITS